MTARPDTLGSDVLDVLDVVGIGFGPANLAVAVVLEELAESGTALSAAFVESKPEFSWHPGMMLPGANMQIAFPKDLATMRNPRSAYTFFNYLHAKGRMVDFINQQTFFPSRHEFGTISPGPRTPSVLTSGTEPVRSESLSTAIRWW